MAEERNDLATTREKTLLEVRTPGGGAWPFRRGRGRQWQGAGKGTTERLHLFPEGERGIKGERFKHVKDAHKKGKTNPRPDCKRMERDPCGKNPY